MNLRAKPLLSAALLLLAIPIILLIGINFYLRTPAIQAKIHSQLESNIGMPVSTQGVYATPFGGLKLTGILAGTEESNPLITADSLIIYPRWFQLLFGKVSIKELVLNHPIVRFPVASTGILSLKSLLNSTPQAVNISQILTSPTSPLPSQSPSFPSSQNISPATAPSGENKTLLTLPHLRILDADLTLLNTDNSSLAAIHGMTLQGKLTCSGVWNGSFEATQATVGTALILHDLHSPITLSSDSNTISLTDLTAGLGGGKLQGIFSVDLPPAAPRYNTTLKLSGALLNQFFADASLGDAASQGNISGDLQLSGVAGDGSSMEGHGALLCTNAVIEPAGFLKQIGQILQIDELQLLRISEGKTSFSLHQGKLAINDLTLHSENLILTAQGPVLLNGDVDLHARLLLNAKMTSRLGDLLGSQLSTAPEPGYSQIQFHVAGPLNNPRTDLLERLTGIHIGGDLGGLLQGLFGSPSTH